MTKRDFIPFKWGKNGKKWDKVLNLLTPDGVHFTFSSKNFFDWKWKYQQCCGKRRCFKSKQLWVRFKVQLNLIEGAFLEDDLERAFSVLPGVAGLNRQTMGQQMKNRCLGKKVLFCHILSRQTFGSKMSTGFFVVLAVTSDTSDRNYTWPDDS